MDQELNSDGICSTCNFRPECLSYMNSRKIGKPILHCEEFAASAASVTGRKQIQGPLTGVPGNKGGALANPLNTKGLCTNCDDADICRFPKSGQDVVFCEEHSSN